MRTAVRTIGFDLFDVPRLMLQCKHDSLHPATYCKNDLGIKASAYASAYHIFVTKTVSENYA